MSLPLEIALPLLSVTGSVGIVGAAVALGLRHGIDWDHIAAITDITSTTTSTSEPHEDWLSDEPGVLLTDESDHLASQLARRRPVAGGDPRLPGASRCVARLLLRRPSAPGTRIRR